MTNKTKLAILMLIITVFAVTALAACTSVGVAGISIKQGSNYKTEYVVGEELDLTGVELAVTRTDGSVYFVYATAVMQDIKVLNFNTSNVVKELAVVIEYKGASTFMFISVISHEDAVAKYTVNFETGSGSKVDSLTVQEFDTILAPTEPTRAGYAFDGWYKENTYNNIWNFNVDKVVGNTTLYAKWAKLYTITFKDTITGAPDVVKYVKAGDSLSDIPPTPVVDGKIITWDRESITEVYSDIVVKTVSKDATYTVLFYYYGFESGEAVVLGQPITNVPHGITTEEFDEMFAVQLAQIYNDLPRNDTVNHKHFSSWDKGYNNVVADLEICAQYEYNKYDVTFNLNYTTSQEGFDATFSVNEDVVYNNPTTLPASEPVRPGYAFDGWYKQPACIDAWNFNNDRVQGDTVLYAKWTALYSVYFVIDQSETIDSELGEEGVELDTVVISEAGNDIVYKLFGKVDVRSGGSTNKIALPVKTGYTASWNIDDNALKNITGDRVVKAVFQINSYAVRFFNHDRSEIIQVHGEDVQMVEYQKAAEAPEAPDRLGYSFIGWDKAYDSIIEAIDVVAVYEPNAYDVILVLNNDSATPTYAVSVKYGQAVTFPENLTYNGYHLEGWYTDEAFVTKWEDDDVLNVAGHNKLILYARWLKIHTVVFNTEEGDTAIEVIDGNLIDETFVPEIGYREGYTGYWYKVINGNTEGKVLFDATAPVEENSTYSLVYELNVYVVYFFEETTSITPYASFNVPHGSSINIADLIPNNPTKEGHNFIGWTITSSDAITGDTNVYAIFQIKTFVLTWVNEDGSTITTSTVEYSKPAVFPISATAPAKKGYLLNGWIIKEFILEEGEEEGSVQIVKSAMVLAPDFVLEPYTVEFKNRETNSVYEQFDGTGYVPSQTKLFNTFVDVNAVVAVPHLVGHEFVGWDAPYFNSIYQDQYFTDYQAETHAWKAVNSNVSSGTHNMRQASLIVYDNTLYYAELAVEEIANRLAHWGKETFDASGIYQIEAVNNAWLKKGRGSEGDTVLTYSREIVFGGHLFVAITENTTFFARFEVAEYNFSFVTNDPDQTLDPLTVTYGTLSRKPVLNDRDGYVFLGWYADEDFSVEYVFDTLVEKDTTIYAKWEEIRDYTESDDVIYTLNEEGTAYVLTDARNYDGTSLKVANFYKGKMVNAIGADAFANNTVITAIDLPNTIVAIGPKAFMNCTALTSIVIPEKVTEIPDNAFYGCTALTTVSFDENGALTKIGTSAFANATALKYSIVDDEQVAFTLPQTITDIGSSAFYGCVGFTEIEIPASIINVGDKAFANANNLRYAIFKRNAAANLGENVFQNHTSLYNAFRIYVPTVSNYTGNSANANWKALSAKIYDLDNITKDGEWAYRFDANGNPILMQYLGKDSVIEISANVISSTGNNLTVSQLDDYLFDGNVTEVKFNSNVAIAQNTFTSATNLQKLIINLGLTNNVNKAFLKDAFDEGSKLHTLEINSDLSTIPDIFDGRVPTALHHVIISEQSRSVIDSFLADCIYVQTVTIGKNVTTIGNESFRGCTALTDVIFNEGCKLASIGVSAFDGAYALANLHNLPNTITSIGDKAFNATAWLNSSQEELIIGKGILYRYNGNLDAVGGVYVIPSNVTYIVDGAFANNSTLRHVLANPDSVLYTIGANAFANCAELETVFIPATVNTIGANAFANDAKLKTVVSLVPAPDQTFKFGANALPGATESPNMKIYITEGDVGKYQSAWSGNYSYQGLYNTAIKAVSDGYVITGNESGSASTVLVKYIPNTLNATVKLTTATATKIADYALARTIVDLDIDVGIESFGELPFNGVTALQSFTIRRAGTSVKMAAVELMWILENNASLTAINTVSSVAMSDLIGGALPARINTVNIIAGETHIVDEFLYDASNGNSHVVNISIDGIALEDADNDITVGAKAFRNTGWMDAFESDYIVIFQGVLVDVKSMSPVLTISDNVKSINGGLFEANDYVEVVFLPQTITSIGERAFFGASKLTKVFVANAEESKPTVGNNAFGDNATGAQIYAPGGYVLGNVTAVDSSNLNHVVNCIDEATGLYEEYVINSDGTLILLRKFMAIYDENSNLESYEEVEDISVPDELNGVAIKTLANNVFMSVVKSFAIDKAFVKATDSFANLGSDMNTITVRGSGSSDAFGIVNVIDELKFKAVAYDGQVTLDTLLGVSSGDSKVASLKTVKIVDGIKTTVVDLLKGWSQIEEVVYPASIEKVAAGSLEDTAWFANEESDFVILGGVLLYRYIGSSKSAAIPQEVMIINEYAFANKTNLSRVYFVAGSMAHTILEYAFDGCTSLSSIAIPDSMTNISDKAFNGTMFTIRGDCLIISSTDDAGETLVKYYGEEEEFVIPNTIKKISAGAFQNNEHLIKLTYDKNSTYILSTICDDAFTGCTNLTTVELPSSVVSIGDSAFEGTPWAEAQQGQ